MQNEKRNLVNETAQLKAALQVSLKVDREAKNDERTIERATWIEMREEDPERWDGMS